MIDSGLQDKLKQRMANMKSTQGAKKLPIYRDPVEETEDIDMHHFNDFRGFKLLIVEDNLINQKILLSVLKESNMDILVANNGQEALDFLFIDKKEFDIVLMDISMPIMDGIEATTEIRKKSEFDNLPIVTFTAFVLGAEIEQMFEAGVNSFLTKPLNVKKLYTVFKNFLGEKNNPESSNGEAIKIHGLDIEKGIQNADNDEALYKGRLVKFVSTYKNAVILIPRWLEAKDYKRIKLLSVKMHNILEELEACELKELLDKVQHAFLEKSARDVQINILEFAKKLKAFIEDSKDYISS